MAKLATAPDYPAHSGFVHRNIDNVPGELAHEAGGMICGMHTQGLFKPAATAAAGERQRDYVDVLYGQVHVMPRRVVFDLLMAGEELQAVVWNAHLDRTLTVQEISRAGTSGTDLSIHAPVALNPTQSVSGTLYLFEDGPAVQDGVYSFCCDDGATIPLPIRFTRARAVPYFHNWEKQLPFSLAYETVLTVNRYEYERRMALTSQPVRECSPTFLVNRQQAVRLKALLARANNRTFAVPVHQEPIQVVSVDGDRQLGTGDISGYWNLLRYCKAVIGVNEQGDGFLRTLESVSAENRTLITGSPLPPEANTETVFFPCFFALASSVQMRHLTDGLSEISLTFAELPGQSQPESPDLPGLPDTYPFAPDWSTAPADKMSLVRDVAGYPGTAQSAYTTVDRDPLQVTLGVSGGAYSWTMALLDNFGASKGRLRRFRLLHPSVWCYTARQHVVGESELVVVDSGWFPSREGKGERVFVAGDGGSVEVAVESHVSNLQTGRLTLKLSTQLDRDIPMDAPVWLLPVVRHDIDRLSLMFATSRNASAVMRFRELVREYDA